MVDKIDIPGTGIQNVDWYEDGEKGEADILNRPTRDVSTVVNALIDEVDQHELDITQAESDINTLQTDVSSLTSGLSGIQSKTFAAQEYLFNQSWQTIAQFDVVENLQAPGRILLYPGHSIEIVSQTGGTSSMYWRILANGVQQADGYLSVVDIGTIGFATMSAGNISIGTAATSIQYQIQMSSGPCKVVRPEQTQVARIDNEHPDFV